MCGQNKYIALQARYCANSLTQEWKAAANRLVKIMQPPKQKNKDRQSDAEEKSMRDYQRTIQEVYEQIRAMQKFTAVISEYPKVMIDAPGSTGDSTSLSCFNEAFHQVQDIVSYLDGEIVRAKQIRRSAESLMHTSVSLQTGFGSLANSQSPSALSSKESVFGKNSRASAISGEIRNVLQSSRPAADRLSKSISSAKSPPFVAKHLDGITATFPNTVDLFKMVPGAKTPAKVTEKSVGATFWNETASGFKPIDAVEKVNGSSEGEANKLNANLNLGLSNSGGTRNDQGSLKANEFQQNSNQNNQLGPFALWLRHEKSRQLASMEADLFVRVKKRIRRSAIFLGSYSKQQENTSTRARR